MRVADYIASYCVERGITDCFLVTGGGAMHLNDALGHHPGMHCTFSHHEQACAIAAEAYCRFSGRLPLVCVTSGPGGLNTMTGVFGAWTDSVPMLILSGQVKRETMLSSCPELPLRQLGDQEADIVSVVRGITKYAVSVMRPEDTAYALEKAIYLAREGRGGPVWLDIPLDVQGADIRVDTMEHFVPQAYLQAQTLAKGPHAYAQTSVQEHSTDPCTAPDAAPDAAIGTLRDKSYGTCPVTDGVYFPRDMQETRLLTRQVLEQISSAKAPLILAGTGIRLAGAEEDFLRLVRRLRIPVCTAWNANDTLSPDSPYFAGMPGTVGTRAGNFAVQSADFLLSLSCRMNIRMVGYNRLDFAKNAYIAAVDTDAAELLKPTVHIHFPVCADVHAFILAMLAEMDETEQEKCREWKPLRGSMQGAGPLGAGAQSAGGSAGAGTVAAGKGPACAADACAGAETYTGMDACADAGKGTETYTGVDTGADTGKVAGASACAEDTDIWPGNAAHAKWLAWCRDLVQRYPVVLPEYHTEDGAGYMNPYVFISLLFSCLQDTDRIVCGNGSACVVTFQAGKIKQGQRMHTNSGCAAMGYALPAAVGVAVSDNTRRTVCIDGDGSFMMNLQELATVVHNKLDIKLFILNNSGYLSIRQTQKNLFQPPYVGTDSTSGLSFPDFKLLAAAFGLQYVRIDTESTCRERVMQVLDSQGPCMAEVIIDPDQPFAPKSSSRVLPDGSIISPTLDDMAPFLSREEYEAAKYKG